MNYFLKKYTNVMTKLFRLVNLRFDKFAEVLQECNALHAGGSLASIMTVNRKNGIRPLLQMFVNGGKDLDVYVSTRNNEHVKLLQKFVDMGFFVNYVTAAPAYDESFMRQNHIVCRIRMMCTPHAESNAELHVDIMIVHEKMPLDVVQNFDLTCCEIWFDGRKTACTDMQVFKSRVATMRPIYVEKFVTGNAFLRKRVHKYEQRGWTIKIMTPEESYVLTSRYVHSYEQDAMRKLRNMSIHHFLLGIWLQRCKTPAQLAIASSSTSEFERFIKDALVERVQGAENTMLDRFLEEVTDIYHGTTSAVQNKLLHEVGWLAQYLGSQRNRISSRRHSVSWFGEICTHFRIDAETVNDVRDAHDTRRERIVYLFARFAESAVKMLSLSDQAQRKLTYTDCRQLEGVDFIMFENVQVGKYLDEDENNCVIIAANLNGEYTPFFTTLEGAGSITDVVNTKYFVECVSADTTQTEAPIDTTKFTSWYQKLFSFNGNICIPLNLLSFLEYKHTDEYNMFQKTRCVVVETPEKYNVAHVGSVEFRAEKKNIFGSRSDIIGETHCNAEEYCMKSIYYLECS